MFTSGEGLYRKFHQERKNHIVCQTVNKFATVTGTENFNSYTERGYSGALAPQIPRLPTPVRNKAELARLADVGPQDNHLASAKHLCFSHNRKRCN